MTYKKYNIFVLYIALPDNRPSLKIIYTICLLLFCTIRTFSQGYDTLRILFPLDKAHLTEDATKFLDSLVANKVLERGKKIMLLGYGDYLGSESYNKNLSYSRAKNIQDYLVVSGYDVKNITLVTGKGKINKPATNGNQGSHTDRKVDIIIESKIDTPAEEKFTYYMLRMKDNETLVLKNIHFYRGSIRITPESIPELKMLYRFLVKYPTVNIQLEGHICCLGPITGQDEPYDESTLSRKRADVVADSMIVYGIDSNRVKRVGHGNNFQIVNPETGAEIEELSRRVEVRILSR